MIAGSSPAAPPPPRAAPASSSQSAPACPSRPHVAQQQHLLTTVRLAAGIVLAACLLLDPRSTHLSRQSSDMSAGAGVRLKKANLEHVTLAGSSFAPLRKHLPPRIWQERAGATERCARMCWQPAKFPYSGGSAGVRFCRATSSSPSSTCRPARCVAGNRSACAHTPLHRTHLALARPTDIACPACRCQCLCRRFVA